MSGTDQARSTSTLRVRAILDAGSQRSYVTTRVQEALSVKKSHSESMIIKTHLAQNKGSRESVTSCN